MQVKRNKIIQSFAVVLVCVTGNIICANLIKLIPDTALFMDTIFTIAATLFGGLIPGIITGLLTNICYAGINALFLSSGGLRYLFALCNISSAIVVFLFVQNRNAFTLKITDLAILSILLTIVNSVLGGLIATLVYQNNVENVSIDYIVAGMLMQDFNAIFASIFARIPINMVDKLVSVVLGYNLARGSNALRTRIQKS